MALAGRLFTTHFGAGSVRSLQVRFTGVAKLGDRISLRASLAGVEDGIARYDLTGRVTSDGAEILTGRSTVAAP
jgi:acyl dehydratase